MGVKTHFVACFIVKKGFEAKNSFIIYAFYYVLYLFT